MPTSSKPRAKPSAPAAAPSPSSCEDGISQKLRAGAVLVAIASDVPTEHALGAIAKLACQGRSYLPVTASQEVRVLFSGDVVSYEAHRTVFRKYEMNENAPKAAFAHLSTQPLARAADALLEAIRKAPPGVLIMTGAEAIKPSVLLALHEAASAQAMLLFLIGRFQRIRDAGELSSLGKTCIVMDACEPDPDCSFAFTIEFPELSAFHDDGVGKAMVGVKRKKGLYRLLFERFIAAPVLDRVIWRLRAEGQKHRCIAEVVGLSVEEVMSRLDPMRSPLEDQLRPKWREKYLELFNFEALKGKDRAKLK